MSAPRRATSRNCACSAAETAGIEAGAFGFAGAMIGASSANIAPAAANACFRCMSDTPPSPILASWPRADKDEVGLRPALQRRLQLLDEVGPLPGEPVALGLASEMAVGCGRQVDRLVEAEMG